MIPITGSQRPLLFSTRSKVPDEITIPLTGENVSEQLKRIDVATTINGRSMRASYDPGPELGHFVSWDGRDAYGRRTKSVIDAGVEVCYVYNLVRYESADAFSQAFGSINNRISDTNSRGSDLGESGVFFDRANAEISTCTTFPLTLGNNKQEPQTANIGEWQLAGIPQLDVEQGALLLPTGAISEEILDEPVLQTVYGEGRSGTDLPRAPIDIAHDGERLYIAFANYIAEVVNGELVTVPNSANIPGYFERMSIDPEGNLLTITAVNNSYLLSRLTPDGVITELTGRGTAGINRCEAKHTYTDGGVTEIRSERPYIGKNTASVVPADSYRISYPADVIASPNGDIFIADSECNAVYRITPSGEGVIDANGGFIANYKVEIIAGNGSDAVSTTDGPSARAFVPDDADPETTPATRLPLASPSALALSPDNRFLYIGTYDGLVRRWSYDDWIETWAGTGEYGFSGDNGPATEARFGVINDIAMHPDGSLYINDVSSNNRIRRIGPNGIVETVVGQESQGNSPDGTRGMRL
ncbi:hypothetical protein BOW52_10580 [Solemya elarraichensis gill symbiont]|uniref:SMP-30/Gluconolactonase/LRE-like region domain-containing protein n=2 Tax=Solemya elarraichensis gill symbiont TaxID=1918949 RepID=A0A1T2KV97_9GAMM|nr:hypothetical protein BOW52_10580 [Solemya elarraichensis gill symbiont]